MVPMMGAGMDMMGAGMENAMAAVPGMMQPQQSLSQTSYYTQQPFYSQTTTPYLPAQEGYPSASKYSQGPSSPSTSHGEDEDRVMVRDLAPVTQSEGVRSYFEQYGEVLDVYLPKDHTTGGTRGFAFVKFRDSTVVNQVISLTHSLDGSELNVVRAAARNKGGRTAAAAAAPRSSQGGGGFYGGSVGQQMQQAPFAQQFTPMSSSGVGAPKLNRIYVAGVSESLGESQMRDHFSEFGQVRPVWQHGSVLL
jgi:RNA recognition motif-containing protein